jgi:branched-chain amino acid transport system substrate-binding protein
MSRLVSRRAVTQNLLTALALGLGLASVSCSKAKGDEIPVGAFLSLSGSDTAFGVDTRNGIDLAVNEQNGAGGVKGKKIRVIYEDDRSMPSEASNKVRQLIDRDQVIAVIGEVASSRTEPGAIIANEKKVPLITPSSTNVSITKGREYAFRVCFTDDQQGDVAARFVKDTLKKNTAALFYVAQDNYSSGLAQSFKSSFEKLGGKIVAEKGYQKSETNYTTYLESLKAANPEVIFTPVYYNDMVQIARQAKAAGITGSTFVGGDGWDANELLQGAGAELEGAYFTNHYAPDVPWENSQAFLKKYRETYKVEPTSMAAQGYDAAKMLFDAIGRAPDMSREAVKTAIADTKGFQGATGTLTIDPNHNANKPIVVVQIKDKKFKYSTQIAAR